MRQVHCAALYAHPPIQYEIPFREGLARMELPQNQYDVLTRLAAASGAPRIGDLAAAIGLDQSPVAAACTELQGRGLVLIEESPYDELSLGKEAEPFVNPPLPERLIVDVLLAQ